MNGKLTQQTQAVLLLVILILMSSVQMHAQSVFINEFLASNATINPDIIDFDDYSDWIELYNAETHTVDLSGYFLTDNIDNPTKWLIPEGLVLQPKSFIRIWADGYDDKPGSHHERDDEPFGFFVTQSYHLNFKLSVGGEELALFDPDTILIDSVGYGLQLRDVSMGRQPDGTGSWVYFGEPTPGARNLTNGTLNTDMCDPPHFSIPSGSFNSSRSVEIFSASPDDEIRYTLDGSRPSSSSYLYSSPIQIDSTTVIRARTFNDNLLPGNIITRTYIIGEPSSLTTMSIAAFPNTLWNNEIGIFKLEMKGREVPVNIEYFQPGGESGFQVNAGIRLSGQASFQYPQKPITIELKDRFGDEFINYKAFDDRDVEKFTSLYLRNSGTPDNRVTMFRDALQHSLVINQMDLDCQAYKPVRTYINGKYWGIYNMRDKINTDYLAYLHNVDPFNIDLLEIDFNPTPVIIEGDSDGYNELLEFIRNNSLKSQSNYEYIKTQMDINEYLNYVITEIYCDNVNWLNTNVKWWREKSDEGKWRWILLDLDWGFGTEYPGFTSYYDHNAIAMATSQPGTQFRSQLWATELFRNLLQNYKFKTEFIQRFAGYLNTTFKTDRVVGIFDSLKNTINDEMVKHIDRWNDNPNFTIYGDPPIMNFSEWEADVAVMRTFAENRTSRQFQHINDFFGLGGTVNLELKTSLPDAGKIIVNNVSVPLDTDLKYFKSVPVNLVAVPNIGYKFKGWDGVFDSGQDSLSTTLRNDAVITAVFEKVDVSIIPEEISATTVLTEAGSPYYAQGNININQGARLTVEPGVTIYMSEGASILVDGNISLEGTTGLPITIAPNTSSGALNWGALVISNSDSVNIISNVIIEGATHGPDKSNHIGALSTYRSDLSVDNLTVLNAPFPVFTQYGNITIANSKFHSDKTCDLINVKYASSAVIEDCEFRGNNSYDTDAIDYDGISTGMIKNNLIYNFYGDNSDGIDLGEESKNIIIAGNTIVNCFDKGISVGQASTCTVADNVIVNCAQGVGVKDFDSYAYIDGNTFYSCVLGVASFEKNFGAGGGHVDIVNSIFSNSTDSPYWVDDLSELTVNYSLADNDELPGNGNIHADPKFLNNFRLDKDSPAINSGDPASPPDPDGSRIDMGAFTYNPLDISVLINEIHYNPKNGEQYEFIELYNSGNSDVDLGGYYLSSPFSFIFPASTSIQASGYLLIAANAENYPAIDNVLDWGDQQLPDKRADIVLNNPEGVTIDFVSYSSRDGWIESPNGTGPSLELRSFEHENMYYANWRASINEGGSPGEVNFETLVERLYINELMAVNNTTIADEYGEYNDWIELYNAGKSAVNLGGLYITDDLSRLTKYFIPLTDPLATTVRPESHIILWADEQSSQGSLHLNFKLNSELEELALVQVFAGDTSVIDYITFGNQQADISYGRLIDGEDTWQLLRVPSPGIYNSRNDLFKRGILLVNGITPDYNDEFTEPYEKKAYWGDYPITFWDCFGMPTELLPSTVPVPIGSSEIPIDTLLQFSSVIWIGNNYGGDLSAWLHTDIMQYLKLGGNVLLMTRAGTDFMYKDLVERVGINWHSTTYSIIQDYKPVYKGLFEMEFTGSQSFVAAFDTTISNSGSKLLFTEPDSPFGIKGLGVWHKPEKGGNYNPNGGQMVYISGRPYRFQAQSLRRNVSFILAKFFGEVKDPTDLDNDGPVIKEFHLSQNYPNPFNPTTTIEYAIPVETVRTAIAGSPQSVKLIVYDVLGQEVGTLINQKQKPGIYRVEFDASTLPSGIYFYRINAGKYSDTKKLVLLK